jgi:uncharacterized protein
MPHFAVLFVDSAKGADAIRRQFMPAHLTFLELNAESILAAGPLRAEDGGARGGLWIVKAASRAEVTKLVHEDPFWPTGLRHSVEILDWNRVFADGLRCA